MCAATRRRARRRRRSTWRCSTTSTAFISPPTSSIGCRSSDTGGLCQAGDARQADRAQDLYPPAWRGHAGGQGLALVADQAKPGWIRCVKVVKRQIALMYWAKAFYVVLVEQGVLARDFVLEVFQGIAELARVQAGLRVRPSKNCGELRREGSVPTSGRSVITLWRQSFPRSSRRVS